MDDIIEIIAKELANNNKIVSFQVGSIFESLSSSTSTQEDINTICKSISQKLVNEVVLIKTKMIPFMSNVVLLVESKVKKYSPDSEVNKYKVVEFKVPKLVEELVSKKEITTKRPVREYSNSILTIPTPTENIRDMFILENPIYNTYASEVVSKYSDEELSKVWDKYLTNISKSNNDLTSLSFNAILRMEEIVLLYILTTNLKDKKPSGVVSPDNVYSDVMSQLELELLNYLAIGLDTLATYRRLNRLVIDIKDKYTIVLDKVILDQIATESFNVEVILGMLIRGNLSASEMLYPNIVANADKYLAEWTNLVKLDRMAIKQKEGAMFSTIYHLALKDLYESMIPGDLKEHVVYTFEEATEVLNGKLKVLPLSDLTNINYMAREIVAHLIFPTSNFHRFTDYMIEYSKLDSTLTQQDAAGFAVLDILLDYLTGQINTSDING